MKLSALGRIALATSVTVLTVGVPPDSAQAAAPSVKRKILPVLVEFSDASFQFPDKVKASTPDTYFGSKKDSAASFLSEVSRGRYTVVPAVTEQFLGPIKLDLSAAGCPHGQINTMTRAELAKRGLVAGEDYDSLSMVFPAQKTNCPWAGLATQPGPTTWINLYGTASGIDVVGHELGHNLGFRHQGRFLCTSGDLTACRSEGSSYKSIMGGGGYRSGFTSPEMIHAGWLSDSTIKVTKSGIYTLRPLHGTGSGTRALDIALGKDRLVLEYRHAAGSFDATIEGVHAYRVPAGTYSGASLIDTTTANKTAANDAPANVDAVKKLTDRANRVSVAVVSSGNGTAKIKVALNGDSLAAVGAPKASPSPTPTASVSPTPVASASPTAGEVAAGDAGATPDGSTTADLAATTTGTSRTGLLAAAGAVALVLAAVVTLFVTRRRGRGKHA